MATGGALGPRMAGAPEYGFPGSQFGKPYKFPDAESRPVERTAGPVAENAGPYHPNQVDGQLIVFFEDVIF